MDDRLEQSEAVAATWAPQLEILDAPAAGFVFVWKKRDACPVHLVTSFDRVDVWDQL